MVVNKKFCLFTIFISCFISVLQPDTLILDAGGTILSVSHAKFLSQFGRLNILAKYLRFKAMHPLADFKTHLQNLYLNALTAIPHEACYRKPVFSEDGVTPLPPLMVDWLTGYLTYEQAQAERDTWLEQNPNYFTSRSDRNFFIKTFDNTFNPVQFAGAQKIIQPMVDLLKECATQTIDGTQDGKKKHICLICSNWDATSFKLVKEKFPQIFKHIDGIILSGTEHAAKPGSKIFKCCYRFIAREFPEQLGQAICFVDDQQCNCDAFEAFFKRHGQKAYSAHPSKARAMLVHTQTINGN